MPIFYKSHFMGVCDRCHAHFDPRTGGVCTVCKDTLCGHHLYASVLDRVRVYFGAPMVCARCRAERGA